jgi:hypothetical protein
MRMACRRGVSDARQCCAAGRAGLVARLDVRHQGAWWAPALPRASWASDHYGTAKAGTIL